jgi:hypothetical protein
VRAIDKLIAAGVVAALLAGVVWLQLVSPERSKASALSAQIVSERATLSSTEASLASARAAVAGYPGDVRALAQVATAVPTGADEPSVITTITKLAGTKVNFDSINVGGAAGTTQGPQSLGLTFSFKATYASLQSFLAHLDQLLVTNGTNFTAHGRLFTIAGMSITPTGTGGTTAGVTASAYYQTPGSSTAADTAATGASQ